MYSEGEQTACIQAEITINSRKLNVFVTHLGNGGPVIQQEQVLDEVNGHDDVILMGDFNFRPNTTQYNKTVVILKDSWESAASSSLGDIPKDFKPEKRIDHIFVSNKTDVSKCVYFGAQNSDHPAFSAVLQL